MCLLTEDWRESSVLRSAVRGGCTVSVRAHWVCGGALSPSPPACSQLCPKGYLPMCP